MGEEDIWAKALEKWNNQDPTWKQQNFREVFREDNTVVAVDSGNLGYGDLPQSESDNPSQSVNRKKCLTLANSAKRVELLDNSFTNDGIDIFGSEGDWALEDVEGIYAEEINEYKLGASTAGPTTTVAGVIVSQTSYPVRSYVRYAWEEEGCKNSLDGAVGTARAEFLYKETVGASIVEAAQAAATDVISCARRLSQSAAILPDLIDQFKSDSVAYKLYTSQAAMEQAITQVTSGLFSVELPQPLQDISQGNDSLAGYMSNASILQVRPVSVEEIRAGLISDATESLPVSDALGGTESLPGPGRLISNYSNLQIAGTGGDTNLSYPETPDGGDIQSFPWYYAGLATAVVRIAIKLSERR